MGLSLKNIGKKLENIGGKILDIIPGVAEARAGEEVAKASVEAARIQAESAEKALAFQKEQYGDIKPYLMGGLSGYQDLLNKPEAYKTTPGYVLRLQEGLKAIGIPAGAKNLSGSQIKAATQYAQDYATNDYTNALRRMAGLSELAQGVGGVSSQYATNVGNIYQQQGGYQAGGLLNAAQARASGNVGASRTFGQMGATALGYAFGGPLGGALAGG